MATLGANVYTLADIAKGYSNGKILSIAEVLSQHNQILEDATIKEGNLPTGEIAEIRTGLPTSYWRLHNQGTPNSKATSAQIQFNCGMLYNRSQIDVSLATMNGDVKKQRMKAIAASLESMAQEMAGTMIYGAASAPEEFVGLANTYNALTGNIGQNVLSAGGSGSDNTSIYFLGWSDETIYTIYPKGSQAGLQHEDLGIQDAFDSNDYRFRAYMDEMSWKCGLVVKDWRYGVRVANIDVSDLAGLTGTQELTDTTLVINMMARAIDRLPSLTGVKTAFYMNRTAASLLRVAALNKSSSAVTIEPGLNQFGRNIMEMRFLGHPIRIVDQILNTESAVS